MRDFKPGDVPTALADRMEEGFQGDHMAPNTSAGAACQSAFMSGAQTALLLLDEGARPSDLHAEILLWARTHVGRN